MSLTDLLLRRIRLEGPLTVAEYMADALLHPRFGYYATRDPFGAAGDFTTAPEISQMFGEMLALCLAQVWMDQGRPPVRLAELGPGRGTLMADILRAGSGVPGFLDGAEVHLVEASVHLRNVQARTLSGHAPVWHGSVDTLPPGPVFLVANEFLDALPIRQHVRAGAGWRERLVTEADGALAFALGPEVAVPELDACDVPDGAMAERCPALPAIVAAVAERVAAGGCALFVDYGHRGSQGDTLQALRGHAAVDPLSEPGTADLTAHVDFAALARAAPPAKASGMTAQGVLLERLGITARAQALAQGLSGAALQTHIAAHRRLTHPTLMGDLFKTMALVPSGADLPPGFDP